MEDLKSFSLYNQRLNKLIRSYQSKMPYNIHSLDASLSKKSPQKSQENKTSPTKFLYFNNQINETMKKNITTTKKDSNRSISKFLMNYSIETQNKSELFPFLKEKRNYKFNNNRSEIKTQGSNRSKTLSQNEESKNKILYEEQIPGFKKPYAPLKISLKYRKIFDKKVEGKFDYPFLSNDNNTKSFNFNPIVRKWDL